MALLCQNLWAGCTFRSGFNRHLHLVAFITHVWPLHFYLFKMEGSLHLIIWILILKKDSLKHTLWPIFLWKLQLHSFFHKDTNAISLNYLIASLFYQIYAHLLKTILTTEANCSDYHSNPVTFLLSSNTSVGSCTVGKTRTYFWDQVCYDKNNLNC